MSYNQRPERNRFLKSINDKNTDLYCLKNSTGIEVYVCNFGATLVSIFTPNRDQVFEDIIQGFDCIDDYQNRNEPFFGSTVGPFANRIAHASFSLNDQQYYLEKNHGEHSLHSGPTGLHQKVWDVKSIVDHQIVLTAFAECGEGGFPGNRTFQVSYTLSDDDQLRIDFECTSDKDSVFSPTNHSYFNLSGQLNRKIYDHQILIPSDQTVEVNHESIPTGKLTSVSQSIFDLNQLSPFGTLRASESHKNQNLKSSNGYDHCYVLKKDAHPFLYDPSSGRSLSLRTDMPGMQLYTANFLNGIEGKNQVCYPNHSAVCLEAQFYPDCPNHIDFPSSRIEANKTKSHFISYTFGLNSESIEKT